MAERKEIKLLDLNEESYETLSNSQLKRWPTMHIPRIVLENYLISVPTLKAAFHEGMQEAILDRYRKPNTIIDDTVGMAQYHPGRVQMRPAPQSVDSRL